MLNTLCALACLATFTENAFVDVTQAVGLGPDVVPEVVARICFAEFNRDGWPDLVVDRHRVFLNVADTISPIGRRFQEVRSGLVKPVAGTTAVFADLDNDGNLDAVTAENVQPDDPKWQDHKRRTRWQRGRGDGTFGYSRPLPTPPRPTIAIAMGDLNRDGKLDLYFANSYKAGDTYEGFPGDLLLSDGKGAWTHKSLPDAQVPFDEITDAGGRPSYGAMILSLNGKSPAILSLSYGRRWNRLWIQDNGMWKEMAPGLGLDGDENRSGIYPDWLVEYAKTHPQFPHEPEKPFRSNGNNFDSAIGDVDNDGMFDLFLADITHAWAGESSDRSRLLFQYSNSRFKERTPFVVDRTGEDQKWNQGDLFAELVDLDCDGWLDLILSSGDYPDQHLRVYLQKNGGFVEAPNAFGVIHDGSQQISLGDVDGDGAPDLVVGQTFNRLNKEQIGGRSPHLRLFVNRMSAESHSLVLRLQGDGQSVNRDALGAIIKIELANGLKMQRQLVGIGGHAGKQHDFVIHFGLGKEKVVRRMEVVWPNRVLKRQVFRNVVFGKYALNFSGQLKRQ